MASNSYNDLTELIKDYYEMSVGNYLNQTITVNDVSLNCDVYRVSSGTILTPTILTGCVANDANTQIIIGKNLSVANGSTLIPPYRCKGIIIGDPGTFTNEGTISMTARGANGEGKNIKIVKNYQISATGGSGGAGVSCSSSSSDYSDRKSGNPGNSPTSGVLSCGGGGSGGAWANFSFANSGAGGSGTSFSGGSGGGGAAYVYTTRGGRVTSTGGSGSNTGGKGGNGSYGDSLADNRSGVGGGAGNPRGDCYNSQGLRTSFTVDSNGDGTGGLVLILANKIISSGNIEAEGVTGAGGNGVCCGGSSGGGCIVLISRTATITGTNSVSGGSAAVGSPDGANGGAGGNGVYASYLVSDLILSDLPVSFAISDSSHLENIDEDDNGLRITTLMDKDELMYEMFGERHRAMCTDATFEDCLIRGEQVPDEIEVNISNPQDGQCIVYDATSQKWKNGGHKYSTTEQVVGSWIDGKPVYERVVDFGALSDGNISYVYDASNWNVELIIKASGLIKRASGELMTIPNGYASNIPVTVSGNSGTGKMTGIGWFDYLPSTGNIQIFVSGFNNNDITNCYVIYEYTKTTDSPTV